MGRKHSKRRKARNRTQSEAKGGWRAFSWVKRFSRWIIAGISIAGLSGLVAVYRVLDDKGVFGAPAPNLHIQEIGVYKVVPDGWKPGDTRLARVGLRLDVTNLDPANGHIVRSIQNSGTTVQIVPKHTSSSYIHAAKLYAETLTVARSYFLPPAKQSFIAFEMGGHVKETTRDYGASVELVGGVWILGLKDDHQVEVAARYDEVGLIEISEWERFKKGEIDEPRILFRAGTGPDDWAKEPKPKVFPRH